MLLRIVEGVLALWIVLILTRPLRNRMRDKAFDPYLSRLERFINEQKYEQAIRETGLFKRPMVLWLRQLSPKQERCLLQLKAQCLEKTGRTSDAVVELAWFLAGTYEMGTWPEDLLSKWIALYKACPPRSKWKSFMSVLSWITI